MDKEIPSDLETFFKQGVFKNSFEAEHHFYVYKKIGTHSEALMKSANSEERKMLAYLQNSSHELAIIYLVKVFENKKDTRNILQLIKKLRKKRDETIKQADAYEEISFLLKMINYSYSPEQDYSNMTLISNIETALKIHKYKIENLKTVRHNYIAHSAHTIKHPPKDTFWNDYISLLKLARLIRNIIYIHFFGVHFPQHGSYEVEMPSNLEIEFYWIEDLIEKITGKNKNEELF